MLLLILTSRVADPGRCYPEPTLKKNPDPDRTFDVYIYRETEKVKDSERDKETEKDKKNKERVYR